MRPAPRNLALRHRRLQYWESFRSKRYQIHRRRPIRIAPPVYLCDHGLAMRISASRPMRHVRRLVPKRSQRSDCATSVQAGSPRRTYPSPRNLAVRHHTQPRNKSFPDKRCQIHRLQPIKISPQAYRGQRGRLMRHVHGLAPKRSQRSHCATSIQAGKANKLRKSLIVGLIAAGLLVNDGVALAAAEFKIVTASTRGTYIQIGRDIASFVAPQADIDLDVLPSAGSAENVRRLRHEPGVKFAIVQSDVYQAFLDQAAAGNAEAGNMIRPLRVIVPLYNEEIYFIVRSDSSLHYLHEIKDAKINAGELGSGTALTTSTLYRLMFGESLSEAKTSFASNEDALVNLITNKTLDVVAVIAGQPAKLLVDMKPEVRQFIKLLKFDADNAASKAALKIYFTATVRASSYQNLLAEDVPGLAVKAFLVTYDYNVKQTKDHLARFARSLCQNFSALQDNGHPKWREVELALPDLGRGWFYYPPTTVELRSCIAGRTKPKAPPVKA